MGAVQFEALQTQADGAPGGADEILTDAVEIFAGEGVRRLLAWFLRDGRGGFGAPAGGGVRGYLGAALPGDLGGGFAAGMGELDRDRDG
jgi:hypothetical protein